MTYIEALQDAIQRMHGCDSRHIESVPVKEVFQGQTVWEGIVEVFSLVNHPEAEICYAWGHHAGIDDKESRYVTVLKLPPVDSPQAAVRAAIIADSKNAPQSD